MPLKKPTHASPSVLQEQRFQELVDGLPQIIFEMDISERIIYANTYALKRHGYTKNDIETGLYLNDTIHPDYLDHIRQKVQQQLAEGEGGNGSYQARHKDGSSFPVQIYSQPIMDGDQVIGLRGIVIDQTETHKAREALQTNERYYRTLFENTGTAMLIIREDGIIRKCNDMASQLYGYPVSEIEGKLKWSQLVAPEDKEQTHKYNLQRLQEDDTALHYEFTMICNGDVRKRVRASVKSIPGTTDIAGSYIDITEQAATLLALKESQERYDQIAHGTHDGIWDWDLITDEVYFSPRYKEIIGYDDNELQNTADAWLNRVHPDDLTHTVNANKQCIEGGAKSFEVEYRMRHKDGSYIWILGRGSSVRDEQGKVFRMIGTHTDITRRKQAETALINSESRLRDMFNNANDGVYRCTWEGRFVDVNYSMARILGYDSPEDLIHSVKNIHDQLYIYPDDRNKFLQTLKEKGSLSNYEVLLQTKGGSRIWISENVQATFDKDGVILHYDGYMQDITARKLSERSEQAMFQISKAISTASDLQELYETIHKILGHWIDATNFFIGLLDEENDAIRFKYFADEIDDYQDIENLSSTSTSSLTVHVMQTGKPLFLSQASEDGRKQYEALQSFGTTSAVWLGVPLIVRDKTIGVMAILHYSNPHHYTENDVTFMEAVSEQIALAIERKTNEEELTNLNEHLESQVELRTLELQEKADQLERANTRLTELDRIKSALVSSISHELRTPLTSIRGFAKLAGRDFSRHYLPLSKTDQLALRGKRIQQNLDIIESEGQRLTRLINDFLDLNRIESGKAEWNDQLLNPCTAIQQAANAVAGAYTERACVELKTVLPESIPAIHADPDKIHQVLVNLLGNALKFTHDGEVQISVYGTDASVTFTVIDTGIGIPLAEQKSIFERFQKSQTGDTVCANNTGTGLGLAICKEIVEHYDGVIWVESKEGTGSEFHVSFRSAGKKTFNCTQS